MTSTLISVNLPASNSTRSCQRLMIQGWNRFVLWSGGHKWMPLSWTHTCTPLFQHPYEKPCLESRESKAGPRESGCIWLLHYRPFHWLGCTELMNWGSGQEPIIGRNEFLSQPSQEACGPGEPALTRVSGKGKKPGWALRGIWIQAWRSRMDLDKIRAHQQHLSWSLLEL